MTDKPKRPRDANQLAKFIVDTATGSNVEVKADFSGQVEGGKAGGRARSVALSNQEKRSIARKAAKARWRKDQAAQEKKEQT